jgi:hypothetical protein
MAFSFVAMAQSVRVKGTGHAETVGDFDGEVLAIGVRDSDPLAASSPAEEPAEPEGLEGYGTTYFLVADLSKPAPVWVAKDEVTELHLNPPRQ